MLPSRIEATLGGAFRPLFGHQTDRVRHGFERNSKHLVGRRHFEIERFVDLRLQARDVVVADMAPVLAQVRGDAVGPGLDRQMRGAQRIGMPPAAGVTDGSDVIDIHAKAQMGRRACLTHAANQSEN